MRIVCYISCLTALQMDKSQSPLSKSSTPSPSHREALTPGAPGAPGAPGPSTSCLRLVSKAASSADPLGETQLLNKHEILILKTATLHITGYHNINLAHAFMTGHSIFVTTNSESYLEKAT